MAIYIKIFIIFIAVNNIKAINYEIYRVNDTISIDIPHHTARTTREMLEKLSGIRISSPESIQEGTEHLLQFGALLRTNILDSFGKLIYDHYEKFNSNEMNALYRIYQDTLDRSYNIFDIVPNVLINEDLKPSAICNYINYHVKSCLHEISLNCVKTKFPELTNTLNNTKVIELTKSIYYSARLDELYNGSMELSTILEYLKSNRLKFTPQMFSGLLHNIQHDDYDDGVRTAERELIRYLLSKSSKRVLLKPLVIQQYNSVSKLLKGFLEKSKFQGRMKRLGDYLSQHITRGSNAVSENIELLGGTFDDDGGVNLKYLFNLVLPDDTIDQDVIDAKNYLLHQISKQNILEKYLKIEKYQQENPSQLMIEILGQLRDINFIKDIVTSLHIHAKFWHRSHEIENLNQLVELFYSYQNLRRIPEHFKLISTIDRLKRKLRNSNNTTIEISCSNPRKCLSIALKMILECNGIDRETKKLISRFLDRSNFQCQCVKNETKSSTESSKHETTSKEMLTTTTKKNLIEDNTPLINYFNNQTKTTQMPINSTTKKPTNCSDDELCENDEVLATGNHLKNDTKLGNNSINLNTTTKSSIDASEMIKNSDNQTVDLSTKLPDSENLLELTTGNGIENSTSDICEGSKCEKNKTGVSESPLSRPTAGDVGRDVTDTQTKHLNSDDAGSTSPVSSSTSKSTTNEVITSESNIKVVSPEPVFMSPKPVCQHHDPQYQQKLKRIEKMNKLRGKRIDQGSLSSLHSFSEGTKNSIGNSNIKKSSEEKTQKLPGFINNGNLNLNSIHGIKKLTSDLHNSQTIEAIESHSSESVGHQETSQSSSGSYNKINDVLNHQGKHDNADEHQHQHHWMTQKHHETTKRNSKNTRRSNTNRKRIEKTEISSNVFPGKSEIDHEVGMRIQSSEPTSNEDDDDDDDDRSSNASDDNDSNSSTDAKGPPSNWNSPLFSNYDTAADEIHDDQDEVNRSKRDLNTDTTATTTTTTTTLSSLNSTIKNKIEMKKNETINGRFFDINIPPITNYGILSNEKSGRTRIKWEMNENDTNIDITKRLFDFNMPPGSNIYFHTNNNQQIEEKKSYRSTRNANLKTLVTSIITSSTGSIKSTTTSGTLSTSIINDKNITSIDKSLSLTTVRNLNNNSTTTVSRAIGKINGTTVK